MDPVIDDTIIYDVNNSVDVNGATGSSRSSSREYSSIHVATCLLSLVWLQLAT